MSPNTPKGPQIPDPEPIRFPVAPSTPKTTTKTGPIRRTTYEDIIYTLGEPEKQILFTKPTRQAARRAEYKRTQNPERPSPLHLRLVNQPS